MANQYPCEIDGITGEVETLPAQGRRYRAKLDTLSDIKREMSKVYRECRTEIIDAQSASKLVWILQSLGKVIESSDIERRLEALEDSLGNRK
jgi:hypothetical protein